MELLKKVKSRANSVDLLVARNLRNRRIEQSVTAKELAAALGVTVQQIQKYEAAKNRISSGNLFYFAQALKVPISYFFGLHLEREPELWINEEQILTIRGGSINIKVNGMQLNNLSKR